MAKPCPPYAAQVLKTYGQAVYQSYANGYRRQLSLYGEAKAAEWAARWLTAYGVLGKSWGCR